MKAKSTDKRGTAMVEFAVVFSLLVLLVLGAGDFARVFFHGSTVIGSSGTGAHTAVIGTWFAAQTDKVVNRMQDNTSGVSGTTASVEFYCECPPTGLTDFSGPGTEVSCDLAATPGTCSHDADGYPDVFVRADIQSTFKTVGPYPGIPHTIEVNNTAYIRSQ